MQSYIFKWRVVLLIAGCFGSGVAYAEAYDDAWVFVGNQDFQTELAITPAEQRQGLMFRKSMQDNQAMLFIYQKPRRVAFWMKNTLIPLDMLFFDDNGSLVEIKENIPPCKTATCPTYPARYPRIKYVLEINAGLSQKLGLKVGDKLYGCGI